MHCVIHHHCPEVPHLEGHVHYAAHDHEGAEQRLVRGWVPVRHERRDRQKNSENCTDWGLIVGTPCSIRSHPVMFVRTTFSSGKIRKSARCAPFYRCFLWSERRDLNSRPPVPQTGALTGLRYAPPIGWKPMIYARALGRARAFGA